MVKIGDRCTTNYVITFYTNYGRRESYTWAKTVTGIYLGTTHKHVGNWAFENDGWPGGFCIGRQKVAVIMPAQGDSYRLPVYAPIEAVQGVKEER